MVQAAALTEQLSQPLEESSDQLVDVPGSKVKQYKFGVGSTAQPEGYIFHVPDPEAFITPEYLYHQVCGNGHFERADGRTMNIVEMIGECITECKQLRSQFKEQIQTDNNFMNGLQSQVNELKDMTERSICELQKMGTKNRKDLQVQVSQMNIGVTENLTANNKLHQSLAQVEQRCQRMEQELKKGLMQLQPAEENN